jgi:C-terminal processing protease CtpA/Prc
LEKLVSGKDGPPLAIKYLENPQMAVITIRSLVRGRAKSHNQDFDKLIDQYFADIRRNGIQKLIIDVRGNEGGNKPEKLYSYIAKANAEGKDGIRPAKNNFEGEVIVLANRRSISAQETFVSIFKKNKRGVTVGEATAGCVKGLCGGKKHKTVLPNSGFEILIPTHASANPDYTGADARTGEGFAPDFPVEENIDTILAGRDTTLAVAIELLKK